MSAFKRNKECFYTINSFCNIPAERAVILQMAEEFGNKGFPPPPIARLLIRTPFVLKGQI